MTLYLYVEVYLMVQEKIVLFPGLAAMTDNVFKQQKRNAIYAAAKAATESAFAKLGLKQCNSGCKLLQTEGKSLEMPINKGFFCFCNVLKIAFYNKITTIQRKMQIKKPDVAGQ